MLRLAVLVSGGGSNLQNLIDTYRNRNDVAEVSCVISDNMDSFAITRAASNGIPTYQGNFSSASEFERFAGEAIKSHNCDFICLAGFMTILTPDFVKKWEDKIVNIHPSLLPSFKGLKTHERAIASGVKVHGCTVHRVTEELDGGPVLTQGVVAVLPGDDVESLRTKVDAMALLCLPHALSIESARVRQPAPALGEPVSALLLEPGLKHFLFDELAISSTDRSD